LSVISWRFEETDPLKEPENIPVPFPKNEPVNKGDEIVLPYILPVTIKEPEMPNEPVKPYEPSVGNLPIGPVRTWITSVIGWVTVTSVQQLLSITVILLLLSSNTTWLLFGIIFMGLIHSDTIL